jgi:hypothetical protein
MGAGISLIAVALSGFGWLVSRTREQASPSGNRKARSSGYLVASIAIFGICISVAVITNWTTRESEHQPPLLSRAGLHLALSL